MHLRIRFKEVYFISSTCDDINLPLGGVHSLKFTCIPGPYLPGFSLVVHHTVFIILRREQAQLYAALILINIDDIGFNP